MWHVSTWAGRHCSVGRIQNNPKAALTYITLLLLWNQSIQAHVRNDMEMTLGEFTSRPLTVIQYGVAALFEA